jgi:hypothetical protein
MGKMFLGLALLDSKQIDPAGLINTNKREDIQLINYLLLFLMVASSHKHWVMQKDSYRVHG